MQSGRSILAHGGGTLALCGTQDCDLQLPSPLRLLEHPWKQRPCRPSYPSKLRPCQAILKSSSIGVCLSSPTLAPSCWSSSHVLLFVLITAWFEYEVSNHQVRILSVPAFSNHNFYFNLFSPNTHRHAGDACYSSTQGWLLGLP